MPRPNQPRDVFAEENLAHRIATERDMRAWSYDGLARRMTEAGCPLDQSAIYKIEKGTPRRRITVDELVGFSLVFGLPVADLLLEPEVAAQDQAVRLLEEWREAVAQRAEVSRRVNDLTERVRKVAGRSPQAKRTITEFVQDFAGDDDRLGKLLEKHFTHYSYTRKATSDGKR